MNHHQIEFYCHLIGAVLLALMVVLLILKKKGVLETLEAAIHAIILFVLAGIGYCVLNGVTS